MLLLLLLALLLISISVTADVHIDSAAKFTNFSNDVNNGTSYSGQTVYLDKDIDFSEVYFIPIGQFNSDTKYKHFNGTFDGQGHIISNLKMSLDHVCVGLFGYSQGGITIKNVVIDNFCSFKNTFDFNTHIGSASNDAFTGGVIGWCRSTYGQCTIENSVNMANISFTGSVKDILYIGGISGSLSLTDYDITVRNCVNYGTLTNYGSTANNLRVGGITGVSGAKVIQNCINYGTIKTNISTGNVLYMGGIVGYNWGSSIYNSMSAGQFIVNGGTIGES